MVPATWVPCPCRSDVSDAPPGDVVKFWPGTRAARSSGWTATPVSRTATTASDSGPSTSLRAGPERIIVLPYWSKVVAVARTVTVRSADSTDGWFPRIATAEIGRAHV